MCPTNTSDLLCGVPTATYLQSPRQIKVRFHRKLYGFLLWTFAVGSSAQTEAIAHLGVHSKVNAETGTFLNQLWSLSDMDGPNRQGLEAFRATWLKMVINIARKSLTFDAASAGEQTHREWEYDEDKAYLWLKDKIQLRQNQAPDSSEHEFSDVATVISNIPTLRRNLLRDALLRRPVGKSARRWVHRNDAQVQLVQLTDRQNAVMDEIEEGPDAERDLHLRNEGNALEDEIVKMVAVYKANGGRDEEWE